MRRGQRNYQITVLAITIIGAVAANDPVPPISSPTQPAVAPAVDPVPDVKPESTWNVAVCLVVTIAANVLLLFVWRAFQKLEAWVIQRIQDRKVRKQENFERYMTIRAQVKLERKKTIEAERSLIQDIHLA